LKHSAGDNIREALLHFYSILHNLSGRQKASGVAQITSCLSSGADIYTRIEERKFMSHPSIGIALERIDHGVLRPMISAGHSAFGRLSWERGLIFTLT